MFVACLGDDVDDADVDVDVDFEASGKSEKNLNKLNFDLMCSNKLTKHK